MQMLTKDSEVEVSSDEDGFKGAWYRATLVDEPTKSKHNKLRIRYMSLLDEDGSSPLTEFAKQAFIRPVPPENLYKDVVLVEGLVVDAYHKDGWWTGTLIKIFEDENMYLVSFDSPPDILQYRGDQLRAHLHWTGTKWVGPKFKELDKSMFSPGTMVEVSSVTNKTEVVAWFPAMLIKEIKVNNEKKFIVKDCNKNLSCSGYEARPNSTVTARRVRPTPLFSCEDYSLMDCVEVFRGSMGWRQGLVCGIHTGKRYTVQLKATKEECVCKHSDLRPFKVWKDGVWHDGLKMSEEEDNNDTNRKRKREEKQNPCLKETNAAATDVEETPGNDRLMTLPFAKKSPVWKKLERKEEFKRAAQSPHFSPLLKAKEDIREWSAVGMMVTFYELLEEVKDLQLDDSSSKISSISSSFAELEKHGFDVSMAQSRIDKMLSLQEKRAKKGEERNSLVKKIEDKKWEKRKFEKELGELKRRIVELEIEEAVGKEKKEEAEKRIMEMEGSAETIEKEIEEVELEFQTTVSAPW